jgi:hypothetical protein
VEVGTRGTPEEIRALGTGRMADDLLFEKADKILPQGLLRRESSAEQIGKNMRLVQFVGVGTTHALAAHESLLRKDTKGAQFEGMGDICTPSYLAGGSGITTRKVDESAKNCHAAGVAEDVVQGFDKTHMVSNLTIW